MAEGSRRVNKLLCFAAWYPVCVLSFFFNVNDNLFYRSRH